MILDHILSDLSHLCYRCNMEMVYGIKFYGVYNQDGIKARRCCCPDYKGEYFEVQYTLILRIYFVSSILD